MKGKWVLIILGILAVFAIVSIAGNAKTIYVGPSEKYTSIQSAIDNATDGDTIIVRDGVYYENIKVTKRLTIKSENGSDNCIIDGGDRNRGNVITLKADGITIEGFTIRNSGWYIHNAGIKVLSNSNIIRYNKILNNDGRGIDICGPYHNGSSNNIIEYNEISNNWDGIYIESSGNNIIRYNNISNNCENGIDIWGLNSNDVIAYNYISDNGNSGILLSYASGIIVINNTMYNDSINIDGDKPCNWKTHTIENNTVNNKPLYYFKNKNGGKVPEDAGKVILGNCKGMVIENLKISNVDRGIEIGFSSQNIIRNNSISNNSGNGIRLLFSHNNNITFNSILNNCGSGISLYESDNNYIHFNSISSNAKCGISLHESDNNIIMYNNIQSNGKMGIFLQWHSCRNRITYNSISNNKLGIYLEDYSSENYIKRNNFIDNRYQAFFGCSSPNHWRCNYWDNWKIALPRPIFGLEEIILIENECPVIALPIPWVNFDWFPAMRPYSID